tara:strand:+ start:813 stop:2093 length:1281 start_codon:yes stop_codon:yes gene_type:complete
MKCKMDDFDSGILTQAKNEYASRLVTILCPLVLEGIRSIYTEAVMLCKENDEDEKYLMTFQNFLSRIIKWNQAIITDESKRIVQKSGCNYLEDLLTCVHIAQLKILTSVRVGQKQKKIDIDIPKLDGFIHKIYIFLARKIYKNVYLYEKQITPLQFQKNMREAEIMCKESIVEVIRDSVPVEKILRAYIDETVDEEIIEETKEILTEDVSNNAIETDTTIQKEKEDDSNKIVIKKDATSNDVAKLVANDVKQELTSEVVTPAPTTVLSNNKQEDKESTDKTVIAKPDISIKTETSPVPALPVPVLPVPVLSNVKPMIPTLETIPEMPLTPKTKARLSFNNTDSVLDMGTNKVKAVEAPKNVERLEHISNIRNEQRKLEEAEDDDDDDEKLTIGSSVNLNKDILGIETLGGGIQLNEPILNGIEILK